MKVRLAVLVLTILFSGALPHLNAQTQTPDGSCPGSLTGMRQLQFGVRFTF
jgi:hypothetical protein